MFLFKTFAEENKTLQLKYMQIIFVLIFYSNCMKNVSRQRYVCKCVCACV